MSEELPDDCPENTADTCGVCITKTQQCYYYHYGGHCTSEEETAGSCCRHMMNKEELAKSRPDEIDIDEVWVPYCYQGEHCMGRKLGLTDEIIEVCQQCPYRKKREDKENWDDPNIPIRILQKRD